MPGPLASTRRRKLGELLVESRLISEAQLSEALVEQKKWGGRLGVTLVELGLVDETRMAQVLATQLNLPTIDLDREPLEPHLTSLLRLDLAERYGVFPLGGDAQSIRVATADPTSTEQLQELGFTLGKRVAPVVSTDRAIERCIRKFYFGVHNPASPAQTSEKKLSQSAGRLAHPAELTVEIDANAALAELMGETPLPRVAMPPHAPLDQTTLRLQEKLEQCEARLAYFQKTAAQQQTSYQALFELLVDSGLVSRLEHRDKIDRMASERGDRS
jgi:type IV pilus assembly protein PilB